MTKAENGLGLGADLDPDVRLKKRIKTIFCGRALLFGQICP